jgi:hypothetical protein
MRNHHAQFMLHAQQHAQHIGVERGRIALCCLLGYETARPLSSGVIDGYIQATKAGDGLVDSCLSGCFSKPQ